MAAAILGRTKGALELGDSEYTFIILLLCCICSRWTIADDFELGSSFEGSVTITIWFFKFSMWPVFIDWHGSAYSPRKGLKMTIRDPKVWLFSILNIAQPLGLSFIATFFPTWVSFLYYLHSDLSWNEILHGYVADMSPLLCFSSSSLAFCLEFGAPEQWGSFFVLIGWPRSLDLITLTLILLAT